MLALISAFAFALGVVPTLVSGVGVAPTDGTLGFFCLVRLSQLIAVGHR